VCNPDPERSLRREGTLSLRTFTREKSGKAFAVCSQVLVAIAISRYARDFRAGAADLGVDLEEHIAFCIEAMKGIAGELGLAGK